MKLRTNTNDAYPEEIQVQLRVRAAELEQGQDSQTLKYGMTDSWIFNLRLFVESEKSEWGEILLRILDGDDYNIVGGQCDATKAKANPPAVLEKGTQYRPVVSMPK